MMIFLALPGSEGEQDNERAPNFQNGQGIPMSRKSIHISFAAYIPPCTVRVDPPTRALMPQGTIEMLLSPST